MAINYDKYIYSKGIHYISNSGKDENNKYRGGKAGDQTGHEWELKKWYNRPWSGILRYPESVVGLYIAKLGIEAALNDKVGYDQSQRGTYWTQLKKANYDPSAINVACEDDCTAGVSANVKAVGHILGLPKLEDLPLCSSRNMRSEFTKAGFRWLTETRYRTSPNYLLPGDILLYENHHAATNITQGKDISPDPLDNNRVQITGRTVWVRKGPGITYDQIGLVHKGGTYPYADEFSSSGNGWYKIEYAGTQGWVSAKYSLLL